MHLASVEKRCGGVTKRALHADTKCPIGLPRHVLHWLAVWSDEVPAVVHALFPVVGQNKYVPITRR